MKTTKVPQGQIPGLASPNRRLGARFIDMLVCSFAVLPLSALFIWPFYLLFKNDENSNSALGLASFVIVFLMLVAYDALMTSLAGRTLGKMALGMRVVDVNGNKLSFGPSIMRAFLMYLLGLIILAGIVLTASILGWVFISTLGRYQQFPHEKASHSFVMMKAHSGVVEKVTPHDDLETLRKTGMISQEEYERKRKEIGY